MLAREAKPLEKMLKIIWYVHFQMSRGDTLRPIVIRDGGINEMS